MRFLMLFFFHLKHTDTIPLNSTSEHQWDLVLKTAAHMQTLVSFRCLFLCVISKTVCITSAEICSQSINLYLRRLQKGQQNKMSQNYKIKKSVTLFVRLVNVAVCMGSTHYKTLCVCVSRQSPHSPAVLLPVIAGLSSVAPTLTLWRSSLTWTPERTQSGLWVFKKSRTLAARQQLQTFTTLIQRWSHEASNNGVRVWTRNRRELQMGFFLMSTEATPTTCSKLLFARNSQSEGSCINNMLVLKTLALAQQQAHFIFSAL